MSKIEINIPEIEFKKDFTIIYKGREDREGDITEPIQEIKTSKEEFLRKLRYFKHKTKEIEITDEIYIHDKYPPRIFSTFIDSIHTNKLEVDEKEYKIISELSHKYEFHELSQEIDQFLQKRPDVEDLINESKFDELDPIKEEKLSQNLDICLQNDNFSKFPIQILVRILNSPKKVLKNHHLLFNFIKKIINQNKPNEEEEENVQVLLSSLDYMQMSDDELDYVFNNENFTSVFNLKNSKERMKSFQEENKLNVKRITTLEEKYSCLISSFESKIQQIEQKNDSHEKNIKKYRKENEELQNSLKNQEELMRNINQVNKSQEDLQKKFVEQEKNLSKYRKENEELQNSLKNQKIIMQNLDQLNKSQDELKDKIFKQEQVLSKYIKENEELKKSLKNQETMMKQYEDSIKITGKLTASVDSNQIIRGQIQIKDKINILDKSRSKYILNTNKSPKIGEMSYEEGTAIKKLTEEIQFIKSAGTYFIHAILVDKQGNIEELVSQSLTTRGANFEFGYTGKVQSVTLFAGKYKIEVWGAEGGENDGKIKNGTYQKAAGKGGYSVGTLTLTKETKLFIHVGGSSKNTSGGWNGGGSAESPAAGGGGGSDISLYGEEGSSNWNNDKHLYSRIIVAGGGGGSGHTNYPGWGFGHGGGLSGDDCGSHNVNGGTQTGGYKFGVGEPNTRNHDSGGGGGWYGGYSYNNSDYWGRGGGGGSGFVYNSTTATQYPSGCKLDSSFYLTNATTISGKDEIPNVSGTGKEIGHRGNGYAKITLL